MPKKTGRPSTYDPEKADAILQLIADGGTARGACRVYRVPISTFLDWLEREDLSGRYALAKSMQLEAWADDIKEIADNASPEDVQVAKLRTDNRKWLLSRLNPERYSETLRTKNETEVVLKDQSSPFGEWVAEVLGKGEENGRLH